MAYDLVIKGGRIVDGIGTPAYVGDIAVQGGRSAAIGRIDAGGAGRVIDADGLYVAPGFIDIHTHFDAQFMWDPWAKSSSLTGVTTVSTGNCGFGFAPVKPADRGTIIAMMERVEGMSAKALEHGLDWGWETLPQYMDALEGRIGVNVSVMVPHSPVRYDVMGEAAFEREATDDELARMRQLVREALAAGAMGFSTSQSYTHFAGNGKPVPSRFASPREIIDLSGVIAEFNVGSIEITPETLVRGIEEKDRTLMMALSRVSGRPVNWNALMHQWDAPDLYHVLLGWMASALREGAQIYAINVCNRLDSHFSMRTMTFFDDMDSWKSALVLPESEKLRALADPQVRAAMKAELDQPVSRLFSKRWDLVYVEEPALEQNRALTGRSIAAIAQERGVHPVDAFLDITVEEKLETRFFLWGMQNGDEQAVREIVGHPLSLPGVSDGGAHTNIYSGYGWPVHMLAYWVRDQGAMTLEEGVRRLTALPAHVAGMRGRGILREGFAADFTLFNLPALRQHPPELRHDFPAGEPHLVQEAEGIEWVIVNGHPILHSGQPTGDTPGQVLRGQRVAVAVH